MVIDRTQQNKSALEAAPLRVFIVDDSSVIQDCLREVIHSLKGVEIAGANGNAFEAMGAIENTRPDVVFLDIRLSPGSGIDLIGTIKRLQPSPVVVMLTNFPYLQYKFRCMSLGADFFFDKTNEFEQAIEVLKQLVESRTKKS